MFKMWVMAMGIGCGMLIASCTPVNVPGSRTVDIPPATKADPRRDALNERRDAVLTVPLGEDVLVPAMQVGDPLPSDRVGPFELRGETLAGALQLVLADYDVPLAFQTDEGLTRQITVANLSGSVDQVVRHLCGLADLYCTYEEGILEVKEEETFIVSLPPLGDEAFTNIAEGLKAVSGAEVVTDSSTKTMIYTVTQRNATRAKQYFQRMRGNTAMVYETYIWEVQLDNRNSAGIRWEQLADLGDFGSGFSLEGTLSSQVGTPVTIGLPTKGNVNFATGDILRFISEQGAVKTISQPQLTVLSGSEASLSVLETRNYIESLTRTVDDNGDDTFSTTTGQVDSGFNLTIGSSWDQSTVYADIDLTLDEFIEFEAFDAGDGETLELPRTSQRELTTQVRARPGDSILIAGLVKERDEYDESGPGLTGPIIPTGRSGIVSNTELVILLRPRVIRYVDQKELSKSSYTNEFSLEKAATPNTQPADLDMLLNPSIGIAPMEVIK